MNDAVLAAIAARQADLEAAETIVATYHAKLAVQKRSLQEAQRVIDAVEQLAKAHADLDVQSMLEPGSVDPAALQAAADNLAVATKEADTARARKSALQRAQDALEKELAPKNASVRKARAALDAQMAVWLEERIEEEAFAPYRAALVQLEEACATWHGLTELLDEARMRPNPKTVFTNPEGVYAGDICKAPDSYPGNWNGSGNHRLMASAERIKAVKAEVRSMLLTHAGARFAPRAPQNNDVFAQLAAQLEAKHVAYGRQVAPSAI